MLKFTVKNPRMSMLIDTKQEAQPITSGCGKITGMIWNSKTGRLTFNDRTASCMYRWDPQQGKILLREHTNAATGNVYDWMGRIYSCESATGNITMANDDMSEYSVEFKGFNKPCGITMMSNGELYFTDADGVYMVYPFFAEPAKIIDDIPSPKSVCFSVDERRAYVSDQARKKVWYYDLALDGTLANQRMFATTSDFGDEGGPDGICVDADDNVWIAAQGGIYIYDKGGILLGVIHLPSGCTSFCFGGESMQTLFFACGGSVYQLHTEVGGQPLRW